MSGRRDLRIGKLGMICGLPTYLVSGERVRDEHDIDFTMGGNAGAYPDYVPHDEIWIDNGFGVFDQMSTALHECIERDLMLREGLSYDCAHDIASSYEKLFRASMHRKRPTSFDTKRVEAAYREYQAKR